MYGDVTLCMMMLYGMQESAKEHDQSSATESAARGNKDLNFKGSPTHRSPLTGSDKFVDKLACNPSASAATPSSILDYVKTGVACSAAAGAGDIAVKVRGRAGVGGQPPSQRPCHVRRAHAPAMCAAPLVQAHIPTHTCVCVWTHTISLARSLSLPLCLVQTLAHTCTQ